MSSHFGSMYPSPTPSPAPGAKGEKPALQGVRNKQRKGVQKANAKFEPNQFSDQLIKHLESVPEGDYDAVSVKLDTLGNVLDYRKYEQELFEILLAGGLLNPGGGYVDDAAPKSSFSVLGSAKEPVEIADMKKVVDVFNKLLRRYKYLQRPFEETSVRNLLQYANKFTTVEQEKLATVVALFVQAQLVPVNTLTVLKKEHLIKDKLAFRLLVIFIKAYLAVGETPEQLSNTLRKGLVTDLEQILPAGQQTIANLEAELKTAGLEAFATLYKKQKVAGAKDELIGRLKELNAEEADADDILSFLETVHKRAVLPEADFITHAWSGLYGNSSTEDVNHVVQTIDDFAPIFERFATKPSIEVALINTIQLWAFERPKLIPAFPKILKLLYSKDVLSDQAIIYWHSKGHKTQGKEQFLKATQPLVTFLQEQEDDEDESDDEE